VIRFLERARYFSVIQSVRTALGINLASCAVGTWDLCPVGEGGGVWEDTRSVTSTLQSVFNFKVFYSGIGMSEYHAMNYCEIK
jgi:hypothetical protein